MFNWFYIFTQCCAHCRQWQGLLYEYRFAANQILAIRLGYDPGDFRKVGKAIDNVSLNEISLNRPYLPSHVNNYRPRDHIAVLYCVWPVWVFQDHSKNSPVHAGRTTSIYPYTYKRMFITLTFYCDGQTTRRAISKSFQNSVCDRRIEHVEFRLNII